MIFTSKMKLLAAVVLNSDAEAVAEALIKAGVLDSVPIPELSGDWVSALSKEEPAIEGRKASEFRKRTESFMAMSVPPISRPLFDDSDKSKEAVANFQAINLSVADKRLDVIASDISLIRDKQKIAQDEILKLEEMARRIESMETIEDLSQPGYTFLTIRAGFVSDSKREELDALLINIPSVICESDKSSGGKKLIIVYLKKDKSRIDNILEQVDWKETKPNNTTTEKDLVVKRIMSKIDELRKFQSKGAENLNTYLATIKDELCKLWKALRFRELVSSVRSSFSKTEKTVIFSGWVPSNRIAFIEEAVKNAAKSGYSIEWLEPGNKELSKLEAPVEMKNPKILKPFESLVRNYAVPEYGSIDPTPFVAIAYLMMFGLMFGDAGHGLVVLLIGLLGKLNAKKQGKPDNLFSVITWCGFAAIIAGVLFGSYFGMAWFPPLWFDYHGVVNGHPEAGVVQSVYDILGITIKFGMGVLILGFIINWVNLFRKKDWMTLLLDKTGILGGWIYGAGAYAAFYFVGHNYKALPPTNFIFWALGLPTAILILKGPIEFFVHKENKKFKISMIMEFVMEWIVEVLEIYSGYLANTLSFMRVAGLGIAHVSLMTAFFQIANMICPNGRYSVWAILILIVGNILVIALEGLSAGIQSLRLNYYEFFSKYFNGTGKAYNPVSLNRAD